MFPPAILLLSLVATTVHPVTFPTTAASAAVSIEERSCLPAARESGIGQTAAWVGLSALFGGLIGYTALSREHERRPQWYVGTGLLIGGGLGLAAAKHAGRENSRCLNDDDR